MTEMNRLMVEIGGVWLFAVLAGLPLFASMGLAAFAFVQLAGLPDSIVPQKMVQAMNSFPIIAAPLFILMGNILGAARITDRIVAFAGALIGWVRGGYAHASILSSMIFAGMVGSAVADAAGTGAIEIRAMRRAGYRPATAAAINAAAATIGPIIPPSLPMVIYGVTADVSIGRLFLAGFIPGIMMGISLMVMVAAVARREGFLRQPFGGFRNIWGTFRDGFFALMAPVILLGGMFSGLVTPTEAAAVATLYALFLGFVVYRTLAIADMPRILVESAETAGLVMALVMVAGALGWCMSISRLSQAIAPALLATIREPLVFLLVCNLVLLLVGCFMETLAALLLLIPILVPAANGFGVDPVQFGLIMIFNLILGTIHPPVGVVLFVTSRIAGISYETMSRAILPWLVPLLVVLGLITLWPPLTLWLPNLLFPAR
jgi:tripartite ATP-independent transporter DctM subunit